MLFVSIIFVSLVAISAVSATDNINGTVAVSNDDSNVIAVDSEDKIASADVDASDVIAVAADDSDVVSSDNGDEVLSTNVVEKYNVISGSKSGNGSNFDFGSLFNGTTISFGNGTSFDFGSLFNGTTISFGNGTSFNTSSLLNANFTFGNGTSFNISSLLGGNGTNFDISSILDMFGGKTVQDSINATDFTKVYTTNTKYSVNVLHGNETLTSGAVTFTVDNKEYVGSWKDDSVYVNLKNLKPGDHFIITEYGQTLAKNKITVKKATPKLAAKNKAFKVKTKTKKYTVTLKTNENKALKNTKVTINVKGKTYSAKTNSKGQATFKLTKLTKVGSFTATVKSAATDCFKSVSKKVTIKVKK